LAQAICFIVINIYFDNQMSFFFVFDVKLFMFCYQVFLIKIFLSMFTNYTGFEHSTGFSKTGTKSYPFLYFTTLKKWSCYFIQLQIILLVAYWMLFCMSPEICLVRYLHKFIGILLCFFFFFFFFLFFIYLYYFFLIFSIFFFFFFCFFFF